MNRIRFLKKLPGIILALTVVLGCLPTLSCSGKKGWALVNSKQQVVDASLTPSFANFSSPERGIMLFQSSVYLTNNGGKDWTTITLKTPPCLSGAEIIGESTYVIGCSCSAVKISRDGGASWTPLEVKNTTLLSFDKDAKGWMATPFALFYYDGTASSTLNVPTGAGKIGTIAFITGTEGYILNEKGTLFFTADNGATWEKKDTLAAKHTELLFANKTVALRFTDRTHGLVAAFDKTKNMFSILETADGGASWKSVGAVKAPIGLPVFSRDNAYLTVTPYSSADKLLVFRNASLAGK